MTITFRKSASRLKPMAHGPGVATERAALQQRCRALSCRMETKPQSRASLWRKANPERAREISRQSYAKCTAEGAPQRTVASRRGRRLRKPEQVLFMGIKNKCRGGLFAFNITLEDIVIPDICPVLGVPIVLDQLRHPHGPSVDKVIPALGYIKGNVRVISMRANRLKQESSLQELKALVMYVEQHIAA